MPFAKNVEFLRRMTKLQGIKGLGDFSQGFPPSLDDDRQSPLVEVTDFGINPGHLRMWSYVPAELQPRTPLVVVLHGCGQTAAGYDIGAGWSALADRYGFALLMPEQQSSNNPQTCFNWFNLEDTTRGSGEACSIRQMVARMIDDANIDPRRVFVTGLSAGGAMTSVMLATYPDIFAGGAIIAGLPFGVATNVREALNGMFKSPPHAADALGDLVRSASPYNGPWPKISVWHGSADRTVNPANADEIVKQWLDVHHLPAAPMSEMSVDGYPHQIWWNADGETVVESYTITDMAHGTPLGLGDQDEHYGAQGAFLIEAGISSSYHIAHFFGLTKWAPQEIVQEITQEIVHETGKAAATKPVLAASSAAARSRDSAPPLNPPENDPRDPPRLLPFDVGAAITRALTAAGLLK